jgi:4-amino-4-deoxy-L-arabinose transferase-like glycosyltransferase
VASTTGGPGGFARDGTGGAGQPQAGNLPGGPGGEVSTAMVSYLEANQGTATYLAATTNSNTAAALILASGQPVMSLGGFSGDDPILTVDQFAQLVAEGQVRYVLLGGMGGGGGPGQQGSSSALVQWVEANGTLVPSSALGGNSSQQAQLYDLAGAA